MDTDNCLPRGFALLRVNSFTALAPLGRTAGHGLASPPQPRSARRKHGPCRTIPRNGLLEGVYGGDVGVFEAGGRASLRKRTRLSGALRTDADRVFSATRALQLRIIGQIDFAHAAFDELADDAVVAYDLIWRHDFSTSFSKRKTASVLWKNGASVRDADAARCGIRIASGYLPDGEPVESGCVVEMHSVLVHLSVQK